MVTTETLRLTNKAFVRPRSQGAVLPSDKSDSLPLALAPPCRSSSIRSPFFWGHCGTNARQPESTRLFQHGQHNLDVTSTGFASAAPRIPASNRLNCPGTDGSLIGKQESREKKEYAARLV